MSETVRSVLISLTTSLLVSNITFILGLKSGKNQADREKLQTIYKKIYTQLSVLRTALERNEAKTHDDYPFKETGLNKTEVFPPIKELDNNGDLLLINKKIAEQTLQLEDEILEFGERQKKLMPQIHSALISDLSLYQDGYKFTKQHSDDAEDAHFETVNTRNCSTYILVSYGVFFDRKEADKWIDTVNPNGSCAIRICSNAETSKYTVCLYPGGIKSLSDYEDHVFSVLKCNIPEYLSMCKEKTELIEKISMLNKKLERRIREPIGFWEMFIGAFVDLFH